MIEFFLFVMLSIISFYFMLKVRIHNAFKILVLSMFSGAYLNISQNGNVVKVLNIDISDEIRILSFIIAIIYGISMFIFFRDKT